MHISRFFQNHFKTEEKIASIWSDGTTSRLRIITLTHRPPLTARQSGRRRAGSFSDKQRLIDILRHGSLDAPSRCQVILSLSASFLPPCLLLQYSPEQRSMRQEGRGRPGRYSGFWGYRVSKTSIRRRAIIAFLPVLRPDMHPYCETQHGYRRREKGNKNAGVLTLGIWMWGCEKMDEKSHWRASYA